MKVNILSKIKFFFILNISTITSLLILNIIYDKYIKFNLNILKLLFSLSCRYQNEYIYDLFIIPLIFIYFIETYLFIEKDFYLYEEILYLLIVILSLIYKFKNINNNKFKRIITLIIYSIIFNIFSLYFIIEEIIYFKCIKLKLHNFNFIMNEFFVDNNELEMVDCDFYIPKHETYINYLVTKENIINKEKILFIKYDEIFIFINELKLNKRLTIYWFKSTNKLRSHLNKIIQSFKLDNKLFKIIIVSDVLIKYDPYDHINIKDIKDKSCINSISYTPNLEIVKFKNIYYLLLY